MGTHLEGPPITGAVVLAVLRRPSLWPDALAAAWRLARPGWWRSWPPVPVPAAPYLRFRQQTHLGGDGNGRLGAHDVVTYLEWCRSNRRALS